MSKYHIVLSRSALGALGIVVIPHDDARATNNTLRVPKEEDAAPIALSRVKDVKFGPGITDFESARRAILEAVKSTVIEATPAEISDKKLQDAQNVLSAHQQAAILAGWNEPCIFRTVYVREGDSNIFTRFPNQTMGRLHGPARADAAVVAVYDGDRNKNAAGLSALTSVIVINAQPGQDDIIKQELTLALSRNNHIVVSSVAAVAEASRLDVAIERAAA